MKIVDNTTDKYMYFRELEVGAVFKAEYGYVFLKIAEELGSYGNCNAFCFNKNIQRTFQKNDLVVEVRCKMIIDNIEQGALDRQ